MHWVSLATVISFSFATCDKSSSDTIETQRKRLNEKIAHRSSWSGQIVCVNSECNTLILYDAFKDVELHNVSFPNKLTSIVQHGSELLAWSLQELYSIDLNTYILSKQIELDNAIIWSVNIVPDGTIAVGLDNTL